MNVHEKPQNSAFICIMHQAFELSYIWKTSLSSCKSGMRCDIQRRFQSSKQTTVQMRKTIYFINAHTHYSLDVFANTDGKDTHRPEHRSLNFRTKHNHLDIWQRIVLNVVTNKIVWCSRGERETLRLKRTCKYMGNTKGLLFVDDMISWSNRVHQCTMHAHRWCYNCVAISNGLM